MTASSRGRNNKSRGKSYERDVAKILGGKRHPADTGGDEDIEHDRFSIQVKSGVRLWNETLRAGLASATAAAGDTGKLPVLVVIDRAGTRLGRYVVIDLGTWADWEGIKQDE